MSFIRTLLRHTAHNKLLLTGFLLSIFIEVAYFVAAPLSLKYLVDKAFMPKDFQMFLMILGVLFVSGLIYICAGTFGDYALGRLSGDVIRTLRTKLFTHVQRQSFSFFQHYKLGDLVTRFSADMSSLESVIRHSSPLLLKETLNIVLGLVMLALIEWKLTLAVLAGTVLMFVGPKWLQSRAEKEQTAYKQAQEQFSNTIDEMVKGYKTIRGLHQQSRFRERAGKQIQDLFSFGLKLHMTGSLMERLPLAALLVLNGTMIGFGGYLIFHDEMTVGDFMAFLTLFMFVGQSGSHLTALLPHFVESRVSFNRIGEILDHEPEVSEPPNPAELPKSIRSIRMEQVTFGYTEESTQLSDVSLEIAAGSYVAFVGPSGSGKSTALQLLSRFYDPKQGAVSINDCDLRTVSEASLRQTSALVTQEAFLFNTTIRDNLLLDNTQATEADMVEAAKQANIHRMIESWPEGYDTPVYHEGGSLSGGERQRLSLARALLRNPRILLLDEVTSALDPVTEADINELIVRLRSRMTIVSVTHRLASAMNADHIYVFENGRIVESGTHQELLREHGLYFRLWEKQHGFHLSRDGLHATVDGERLAKLPFFQGMELPLLHNIASLFSTETSKEGDTIVSEGEAGNKFYIIVRGKFEILKHLPGQGEVRVAVLQDGDHFGEIALLNNVPRNATVKALCPSVLLSVRQEAFQHLISAYPQILTVLQSTLQQRM
ncbi:ABC transporter transmembrane domain-containing protein [Paenibacillus thalictri]|uniref:ATP-binding cassette domain-containing protein n=1 Tax=Paenibacillus thalictri TaxID=2527873 RepID=A0A4Q9DKM4_9BACL|nr:ABC transporter transmembrane domain-containing protein [Paenibacillus thalictri]TBL72699.1 ATP-binding cassette domain-containing protein [Paenibacillus thalictri]